MRIVKQNQKTLTDVLGVLALELRLIPNFDVVALIGIRHDEEWIVDPTFALQLFNRELASGRRLAISLALAQTNSGTSSASSSRTFTHCK